uniref:D-isomer specific 2-hydroxyacid dehydrogenase catalytic domain-containing protein n=1 Tax=Physcomitrium patens TaxID=3218 RepID=A0A7I4F5J3_PHYPA
MKSFFPRVFTVTNAELRAYMNTECLQKAKHSNIVLTRGVGFDHIDVHTSSYNGITIAKIIGKNVVSVPEIEFVEILSGPTNVARSTSSLKND